MAAESNLYVDNPIIYNDVSEFLNDCSDIWKVVDIRPGTYGLVYIREANRSNAYPRRAAAKTIPSEATDEELSNFGRELEIWFGIPRHRNVLSTTSRIQFANIRKPDGNTIRLPIVYMPYCADSLDSWVGAMRGRELDAYMVLAHTCNGLSWLYDHGVAEHGDIKPSNILLADITADVAQPINNEWLAAHPWEACVADLGWANAWRDLGYSDKALRPYLAPERVEGSVIPMKSDMFSVGVVAAELFQGFHPAGKPTQAINKWKKDKWLQWCVQGSRVLPGTCNSRVSAVIKACLDIDPAKRPDVKEIREEFLRALQDDFNFNLTPFIVEENNRYKSSERQFEIISRPWRSGEVARLSDAARDKQIAELSRTVDNDPSPLTPEVAAAWLLTWQVLGGLLLARKADGDAERVASLAIKASLLLAQAHNLGLDMRQQVLGVTLRDEEPYEPIERFFAQARFHAANAVGKDSIEVQKIHQISEPFEEYAQQRNKERGWEIFFGDNV